MSPSQTQPAAPSLRPGDKLDKYNIVEQIGAGGMSVVWKGHDPLLDRFVAIKQVLVESSDPESAEAFREKFRREAQVQKSLSENSKHLVRLIDVLEEPRGLFLVMEYVDGPSLEQILAQNRKPMEVRQAMGIVGATALALDAIHTKGLLHRDLKPSNILMPRAGGLKIADFGLASLIAEQDSLSHGSARYMAPELFADESADGRADLYSLGMIAYEALAGRAVFEETFRIVLRDQRNQPMRWMKWHTSPRAQATPLAKLTPSIPANVSELVARLMEKDRIKRIGSAQELLETMQRLLSKTADEPKPHDIRPSRSRASAAEATAPLPKRSKLPYILAGVLFAQVLIGVGIWVGLSQKRAHVREQRLGAAQAEFDEARATYQTADKLIESAGEEATPEQLNKAIQGFESARATFERLSNEWPSGSNLALGSRARDYLSRARLAMLRGQYGDVKASLDAVEETHIFDENRDILTRIGAEANRRMVFEKTITDIEKLIADRKLPQARERLTEEQNRINRTPREIARLTEVGAEIEDQLSQTDIDRYLGSARKFEASGNLSAAVLVLTDALRKHRSPDLQKYLNELNATIRINQFMADGQAAITDGKLREAAAAFDSAAAIRPNPALTERAATLRAQATYQDGVKLLADGNAEGARDAFTRALGFHEHANARKELNKIVSGEDRAAFIRAGDAAIDAGDFTSAINQYLNAAKLESDSAIQAKILDARVRSEIRTGRDLLDQGRLDEAKECFLRAQALRPDSRPAQRGLAEVAKQHDYRKHLEAGDKLRKESRFGEAKREYLRAREVWETPDVVTRLTDTEYDQWMAQGKQCVATQNWTGAKAAFQSAARVHDTEEVQQMLAEVARHEKPTEP
ncbi:MAG: protein kinase [Planctomycetes bacterium]|nr:protein kinase [Planctomycetota bacterium]